MLFEQRLLQCRAGAAQQRPVASGSSIGSVSIRRGRELKADRKDLHSTTCVASAGQNSDTGRMRLACNGDWTAEDSVRRNGVGAEKGLVTSRVADALDSLHTRSSFASAEAARSSRICAAMSTGTSPLTAELDACAPDVVRLRSSSTRLVADSCGRGTAIARPAPAPAPAPASARADDDPAPACDCCCCCCCSSAHRSVKLTSCRVDGSYTSTSNSDIEPSRLEMD